MSAADSKAAVTSAVLQCSRAVTGTLALGFLLFVGCSRDTATSPSDPKPPELSTPLEDEATTIVRLQLPANSSVAPGSLRLFAGVHEARNDGAIGAANLDTSVVQLLVAATGNGTPVLLGIVAGRSTGDVILDATATAEALVLLSPVLATSDPTASRRELALVRLSPKFTALRALVSAKISSAAADWLAQDDPVLAAAVEAVVLNVQPKLATILNSSSESVSSALQLGPASRNGITVTGASDSAGYSVSVENSRSRWLAVVARLSLDNVTFGQPLDPRGFGPSLPTLIRSSKLINLVQSKPSTMLSLGSTFATARIKVFGPGFGSGGPSAFDDVDADYMIWPSTATAVFDLGLPIVQLVLGINRIDATVPGNGASWQAQWIRLTVNCLTNIDRSFDERVISPVVLASIKPLLTDGSLSYKKFAGPTLKCAFKSATESQDVLLAILSSVGKAGAFAAVVNNLSFLKLPFLLWGAADLGKTIGDVAVSDALTVFDIANPAAPIVLQPGSALGEDVWIASDYSYGDDYGVDDQKLQVGGWADLYHTLIRFDLSRLPRQAASAAIVLQPFRRTEFASGDFSTPVPMSLHRVTSAWDESTGWFNRPTAVFVGNLPEPVPGAAYRIDVTSLYNAWQSDTPNLGIELRPSGNDNRFNVFRSSDYQADPTQRPKLEIIPLTVSSAATISSLSSQPVAFSAQAGGATPAKRGNQH